MPGLHYSFTKSPRQLFTWTNYKVAINYFLFQETGAHKLFAVDHKQEFDAHENCGIFVIILSFLKDIHLRIFCYLFSTGVTSGDDESNAGESRITETIRNVRRLVSLLEVMYSIPQKNISI